MKRGKQVRKGKFREGKRDWSWRLGTGDQPLIHVFLLAKIMLIVNTRTQLPSVGISNQAKCPARR